jgi:uncharacterized protein YfeS
MEENYGIDIDHAHPKAVELIPEEFFWSCIDELAPFGSDEGDMALAEYRDWRKENPNKPTIECLHWVIESVGEMEPEDYNRELVSEKKIKTQLKNSDFDAHQYIYTLDVSVIATGFAQLVDEGVIDKENKPIIQTAIDRQICWAQLSDDREYGKQYIANLEVLTRALKAS